MHFIMSSAICFSLDLSKILSSGNGLNSCVIVWLIHPDIYFVRSDQSSLRSEIFMLCFTDRKFLNDSVKKKRWQKRGGKISYIHVMDN